MTLNKNYVIIFTERRKGEIRIMYAHYNVIYYDDEFNRREDSGIVFGADESELITNLKHYYGDFGKVSIWFNEDYDCSVVPAEYLNIDESSCV